jgi:hypothetical protein
MTDLIPREEFKHAFDYVFRMNKNISNGVVTIFFIFPPNFQINGNAIDKYVERMEVKESDNGIGVEMVFKDKELGEYFWNKWHFNYKFEV